MGKGYTIEGPQSGEVMTMIMHAMQYLSTEGLYGFTEWCEKTEPECDCGNPQSHLENIRRHTSKCAEAIEKMLYSRLE
jgi:hypothetical protein